LPSQESASGDRVTPHQNLKALRHFLSQARQARQVKLRIARSPKLCRQFDASSQTPGQETPGAWNGRPPAIQPIDLGEEFSPTGLGSGGLLGIGGVAANRSGVIVRRLQRDIDVSSR